MKVQLVKLGKLAEPLIGQLVADYEKRLRSYCDISSRIIKNDFEFQSDIFYVGLDDKGKMFTSLQLSQKLDEWRQNPGIKNVCFVIGGPFGLDDTQKAKCQMLWSLSPATFTSDMAWLITWEQIYRGYSILHGSSYHHE